jgi:aromatic ring hydroxylase
LEYVSDALGEDHDVELVAVEGKARDVLLQESGQAALLVLDSPAVAKLYGCWSPAPPISKAPRATSGRALRQIGRVPADAPGGNPISAPSLMSTRAGD